MHDDYGNGNVIDNVNGNTKDVDSDVEDVIAIEGRIPNDSQTQDDIDARDIILQILEELPPDSVNKATPQGERGGKSEDGDIGPGEVPPVHQHQNEGAQAHRQGEG